MKILLIGLLSIGSLSAFADDCQNEEQRVTQAISSVEQWARVSTDYIRESAEIFNEIGLWLNRNVGNTVGKNEGAEFIKGSVNVFNNASTLDKSFNSALDNVTKLQEDLIKCLKNN